mmetsp:Transcript_615/g.1246  ORF Transcript_615/g.1246 Transcript_615/m.1246 type:complete len:274 (-) Transcript_615:806-1627(-)
MASLRVSGRAREAVRRFFETEAGSAVEEVTGHGRTVGNPVRAVASSRGRKGVGAVAKKSETEHNASEEAERRLQRRIRSGLGDGAAAPAGMDAVADESDGEDLDGSRTAAMISRKRVATGDLNLRIQSVQAKKTSKKRSKQKTDPEGFAQRDHWKQTPLIEPTEQCPSANHQVVTMVDELVPPPKMTVSGNGTQTLEEEMLFREDRQPEVRGRHRTVNGLVLRRTKTRSRARNLRRDKRREDQKPSYLTEETLHIGKLSANKTQALLDKQNSE